MTDLHAEARDNAQADRVQIRRTLLDADLSEIWLRAKATQLLNMADELARQLDKAEQQSAFYHSAAGEAEQEAERYREALELIRDTAESEYAKEIAREALRQEEGDPDAR